MRRVVSPALLALVLAVLAALMIIAWPRGHGVPQVSNETKQEPTSGKVAGDARSTQVVAPADATEAARSEVPHRSDAAADAIALIRGRCVDENGAPLEGVSITLDGVVGNAGRLARYRLEFGELKWTDPQPVVTRAEGRFEFRFDPPSVLQFAMQIRAEGRITVAAWWDSVKRGEAIELGDVVLARGVRIAGVVVDETGAPVGGCPVTFAGDVRNRRSGALELLTSARSRSDDSGRFATANLLPVGTCRVEVEGRPLLDPKGPIELRLPSVELRIVVGVESSPSKLAIVGRVTDLRGQAIEGVQVSSDDRASQTWTAGTGLFKLLPPRQWDSTGTRLWFIAAGYVDAVSATRVPWGTPDFAIAMKDGSPFTVRVRRSGDGAPVESFGIVLRRVGSENRFRAASTSEVQQVGVHRDGVLVIERVTPDRYRMSVVPGAATGLASSPDQDVTITETAGDTVDVVLKPLLERVVEVVDSGGVPIDGALLELIDAPVELRVDATTNVATGDLARISDRSRRAILHTSATTDARGHAALRAPRASGYTLRTTHQKHAPSVIPSIAMDDPTPLLVVLGDGALVRGRITPPEVVAALREAAGLPGHGDVETGESRFLPSVVLLHTGARGAEGFPPSRSPAITVGEDGAFEIRGVPDGTWDLDVFCWRRSSFGNRTGSSTPIARALELRSGDLRELTIDLGAWVPTRITLAVSLDGRPYEGPVFLRAQLDGAGHIVEGKTDSEGRIELSLRPGLWTPVAHVHDGHVDFLLPGSPFTVGTGDAPRIERLDVRVVRMPLLVLDPDGKPIAGIRISALGPSGDSTPSIPPTDTEGRTTMTGAPASYSVSTVREPLREDSALTAWMRQQPGMPPDVSRAYVDLGELRLDPLDTSVRTVRLPAEWRKRP
ncbi:MAG: carboxypeptidase-like regulatory domain-containing protein [Planctomycetota bacterium]